MGKQQMQVKQKSRDEKYREGLQNKQMEEKKEQLEKLPVNTQFLKCFDENGGFKYPIVDKIMRYENYRLANIEDYMRQVAAYIAQIRHHQNRIVRLEEQYDGVVVECDERGRLYSKPEIQLLIVSEKIAIPRDLEAIRDYCVHKILLLIDGERFTGEQFNHYICMVNKAVYDLGYDLFPDKITLIYPEFK